MSPPEQPTAQSTAPDEVTDPVWLAIEMLFEPERRAGRALPGGATFELDDFLATPDLQLDRPVARISVRLRGRRIDVPYDSVAETFGTRGAMRFGGRGESLSPLDEFLDAAYLFGGWNRVDSIRWQLGLLPVAVQSIPFCAQLLTAKPPPREVVEEMAGPERAWSLLPGPWRDPQDLLPNLPRPNPDPWALKLAEYLAEDVGEVALAAPGSVDHREAVERAVRVAAAIEDKTSLFIYRLLGGLREIEATAKELALRQLASTRQQTLSEGWRLLGRIKGATFEEWEKLRYTHLLRYSEPAAALAQLHKAVLHLASPAQAVLDAHLALAAETFRGVAVAAGSAMSKGMATPGPLGKVVAAATFVSEVYLVAQSPRVLELRTRHAEAQAALARELLPAANRFPVLLRFTPSELADAAAGMPNELAVSVYFRLVRALQAADAMKLILEKPQPLATSGPWPARQAPEKEWARGYAGSVWAYGKMISAASEALFLTPEMLAAEGCRNMLAAVEEAKAADASAASAYAVLTTALPLALGLVCPPAGIALDAAFGIADAIMEHDVYQTRTAEYYCALDPADSFGDVEPSMLPFVMAVAGVALSPL